MKRQRRTNLLWGMLSVVIAVIILLRQFDVVPDGLYDLFVRAWPALLVIVGLSALLRSRIPFANIAAVVLSLVLVGVLALTSYSTRATEERTDQQLPIAQPVSPDMTLLEISLETLATEIEIESGERAEGLTGVFVGSTESQITVEYAENTTDSRASFIVREVRPNQFPVLEAVGRGRLRLQIPAEIPVALVLAGADGSITLNLSDLALERLTVLAEAGNVVLTLPDYTPLSPNAGEIPNEIRAPAGDIALFTPQDLPVRFELQRGPGSPAPLYEDTAYRYLANDVLEARTYEDADARLEYMLISPQQIRVTSQASIP